jgi:uncharacterized protein (TIGR03435 family)
MRHPAIKKAALTVAGLAALALPVTLGIMHGAQSPAPAAIPKFEVASIKPCSDKDSAPAGKRGASSPPSPGGLHLDCTAVWNLVQSAYVLFANGRVNPRSHVPVEGGPAWIRTASYRIDAKPGSPQTQGMMRGPMLQALLADRFQLKIHRETREVPAYALTVAKGGPKLHPFQEGTCTPVDLKILEQFPPPRFPELPPGQSYCGGVDPDGARWVIATSGRHGTNATLDARALSIDDFIQHSLGLELDRPIFNQTRIAGRFDFHLEFAPEETTPAPGEMVPGAGAAAPSEPAGPSIFNALEQQLGLRLEPAKTLGSFLVIDRVEKPSAN